MSKKTPYYSYDAVLLEKTIDSALSQASVLKNAHIHYALKANSNPEILKIIASKGLGADCVSGGEIKKALEAGFRPEDIVFAGVGKTDEEIEYALDRGTGCFNVESVEELEVLSETVRNKGVTANVALRLNPDIKAHTISHIATGMATDKFGITPDRLPRAMAALAANSRLHFRGIHCHIGSQIRDMSDFRALCTFLNTQIELFEEKGLRIESVNVGGGLGVDYENPLQNPVPDFKAYFSTFAENLKGDREFHCELGRSIVAQCGRLVSRCVYVKSSMESTFVILDAGMNDFMRPALYGAIHKLVNLSNPEGEESEYDVVGPICETTDCFARSARLPQVRRGDMIAVLTAGAYGESMASTYNSRPLPEYEIINK